jgi:glutamate formiminotransferase / 5-formyltetrahydrofolate cyclo-ligase
VLEAVPNVSEGRDPRVVTALGEAFGRGVALLDVHTDADHNRSVFTLAGDDAALVDALVSGIAAAAERIDLRRHTGVHPRVGAADVVPLVPLRPEDLERANSAALEVASRVGDDLGLPVFLYGEVGGGRRPAFFRRGGLEELTRLVEAGELAPDAGPSEIDLRCGVVLVGARRPLVAYNLVLASDDVEVAREIAAAVRESGGGMPGLQAIGLRLGSSGRAQVSMNVIDVEQAPLHEVVERVRAEAAERGVEIESGELVGLVPESVLVAASEAGVDVPGVDPSKALEPAVGTRLGWWPGRSS